MKYISPWAENQRVPGEVLSCLLYSAQLRAYSFSPFFFLHMPGSRGVCLSLSTLPSSLVPFSPRSVSIWYVSFLNPNSPCSHWCARPQSPAMLPARTSTAHGAQPLDHFIQVVALTNILGGKQDLTKLETTLQGWTPLLPVYANKALHRLAKWITLQCSKYSISSKQLFFFWKEAINILQS